MVERHRAGRRRREAGASARSTGCGARSRGERVCAEAGLGRDSGALTVGRRGGVRPCGCHLRSVRLTFDDLAEVFALNEAEAGLQAESNGPPWGGNSKQRVTKTLGPRGDRAATSRCHYTFAGCSSAVCFLPSVCREPVAGQPAGQGEFSTFAYSHTQLYPGDTVRIFTRRIFYQ